MRKNARQWIATAVVMCGNLFLWSVPSNLAYTVAQHRNILLGRYTVERFSGLLTILIISMFVIASLWAKPQTQAEKRQGLFKTIALSISIILSLVVADIAVRILQGQQYRGTAVFYNRTPNTMQHGIEKDTPLAAFSYPMATAGFPQYPYALTVDKRGFRNKMDLAAYDAIALGDSFTEGSHVSDEHPWPVVLSQMTGISIYNLGMSGGSPVSYAETLKRFGVELHPKLVFCMFYEGNDFRSSNFTAQKMKDQSGSGWSMRRIFKSSPLRTAMQRLFIKYLGPADSNRFAGANVSAPNHPLYPVSWLPVTIPDGPSGKHYAFEIKALLAHYDAVSKQDLQKSAGWQNTFAKLTEMKQICSDNGIRLIIVYAPDKPHILMPLIKDKISAEQLLAYMALKKKNLPPHKELIDALLNRVEVQESMMKDFCQQQSIEFISLTGPLRLEITNGTQAYFTYDQHWSPAGHEIVAKVLSDYLKNSQAK